MNHTSNTKLTSAEKAELKSMQQEAQLNDIETVFLDNATTLAYKDLGETVQFALAIKSGDEKKFRCNVGEFYALDKFMHNQTVTMQRGDFAIMVDTVWDLQLD